MTFSTAVSVGTRLNCWNTKPISRARIRVRSPSDMRVASRPPNDSSGAGPWFWSGLWSSPSRCIRVLLPEPDGPMIATSSPASIETSTPRRAWTSFLRLSL